MGHLGKLVLDSGPERLELLAGHAVSLGQYGDDGDLLAELSDEHDVRGLHAVGGDEVEAQVHPGVLGLRDGGCPLRVLLMLQARPVALLDVVQDDLLVVLHVLVACACSSTASARLEGTASNFQEAQWHFSMWSRKNS